MGEVVEVRSEVPARVRVGVDQLGATEGVAEGTCGGVGDVVFVAAVGGVVELDLLGAGGADGRLVEDVCPRGPWHCEHAGKRERHHEREKTRLPAPAR